MARGTPVPGLEPKSALRLNASQIVRIRLADVLEYLPAVRDPEDVRGLHDLRITVKRLRYALEFLHPAFGRTVRRQLKRVMRLQESLGEVTDCDAFLARIRDCATKLPYDAVDGAARISARLERRRAERYAETLDLLDDLANSGLWAGLLRDTHH